jgi:prepilin-type N-terminal cleavage/methylation domain-containing protein
MRSARTETRRGGFTLVELMIAVAIIGVLSATAITAWSQYQFRSKRTEAMTNLEAIARMEIAHFGANGVFWGAAPMPPGLPTPYKRVWDAPSKAAFGPLGYEPEGTVVYTYDVNDQPADCACPVGLNGFATCFSASAIGDLDGDGVFAVISYFHTDPVGNTCVTWLNANPPPIDPNTGSPMVDRPVVIPVGAGSDDY